MFIGKFVKSNVLPGHWDFGTRWFLMKTMLSVALFWTSNSTQEKTTTPRKATRVALDNYKKVPIAFGDQQLSERNGTLQCSAGPEWYGCHGTIDTLASTWAHQLGASQHAKKKLKKKHCMFIPNTIKKTLKIFPRSLPSPSKICMMSVQAISGQ